MGYLTLANCTASIGAILKVLDYLDEEARSATTQIANELYKIGAFVVVATVGSLRGYKAFYTDLTRLRNHIIKGERE